LENQTNEVIEWGIGASANYANILFPGQKEYRRVGELTDDYLWVRSAQTTYIYKYTSASSYDKITNWPLKLSTNN
jgi:hypothetical protein